MIKGSNPRVGGDSDMKPAGGDTAAVKALKFIQLNMNKAGLAAISLNERLKSIKGDCVCLITEPYNFKGKAASIPSNCLLYTSPSPRDLSTSRMPSSA